MVAGWLAGAGSKGRGKGETELECPTIGREGEQFRRVLGALSMAGVMLMLIGGNILGYEAEPIRNAVDAFCRGDGGNIDSTECSSNCGSGDTLPEGSEIPFRSFPLGCGGGGAPQDRRRMAIGASRSRRPEGGQESRRSASGGLPLFLRFSGDRTFRGIARNGEAWRNRNQVGQGRFRVRKQGGG
jgi:hypothetical protein